LAQITYQTFGLVTGPPGESQVQRETGAKGR
jgi:hypothetical protein